MEPPGEPAAPPTRGRRVSALEEGSPPPTLAPASRTMRSQVVAVSSLCGLRHEPRKAMARNRTASSTPHCSAKQVFCGAIILVKAAYWSDGNIRGDGYLLKKKKLLDSR